MAHTIADFPRLQKHYLRKGGSLWRMLKKDLEQIIEMPSHFDAAKWAKLGSGLNLSLMMVAMGGLEAIATLANIEGLAPGSDNATDMVKNFMTQYFSIVNTRYSLADGDESMTLLVWDAFRNGGLHRFVPKQQRILATNADVWLDFGVTWPARRSSDRGAQSLKVIRKRWKKMLAPGGPELNHLRFKQNPDGSVNFWICSPFFVLEFVSAVKKWMVELNNDENKKKWFIAGVNMFESGLELGSKKRLPNESKPSRKWLIRMVNAAIPAEI